MNWGLIAIIVGFVIVASTLGEIAYHLRAISRTLTSIQVDIASARDSWSAWNSN